ncbi:MAG: transposase [Cycloclasticus sp.]|nr:transposase [Cycloclasticus sp.]
MQYRRADIKGATYFFTVNLANRKKTALVDNIDALRESIRTVKNRHPFKIDAMVIMPNHLHAMLTLPEGDNDYATRWSLIKSGFSRQIPKIESISPSRATKGERGIWQRRYWEHCIRDDRDYEAHVNYIHDNPVKHGYVKHAVDWPYSSIHQHIKSGYINKERGNGHKEDKKRGWGE